MFFSSAVVNCWDKGPFTRSHRFKIATFQTLYNTQTQASSSMAAFFMPNYWYVLCVAEQPFFVSLAYLIFAFRAYICRARICGRICGQEPLITKFWNFAHICTRLGPRLFRQMQCFLVNLIGIISDTANLDFFSVEYFISEIRAYLHVVVDCKNANFGIWAHLCTTLGPRLFI